MLKKVGPSKNTVLSKRKKPAMKQATGDKKKKRNFLSQTDPNFGLKRSRAFFNYLKKYEQLSNTLANKDATKQKTKKNRPDAKVSRKSSMKISGKEDRKADEIQGKAPTECLVKKDEEPMDQKTVSKKKASKIGKTKSTPTKASCGLQVPPNNYRDKIKVDDQVPHSKRRSTKKMAHPKLKHETYLAAPRNLLSKLKEAFNVRATAGNEKCLRKNKRPARYMGAAAAGMLEE